MLLCMKFLSLMARTGIVLILAAVLLAAVGWFWLGRDLPDPQSLPGRLNTPSVRIVDRNGRLLYEALAEDGGRHAVVALEDIPKILQPFTHLERCGGEAVGLRLHVRDIGTQGLLERVDVVRAVAGWGRYKPPALLGPEGTCSGVGTDVVRAAERVG